MLYSRLDEIPQRLNRVELWRVAWLEDQRHVQIFCPLLDDLGHVAPVVVDHHVQVRISGERARLPYLHEEVADLDLVGGAAQHVDEVLEEGADGAVDSDAAHSTFVDHQLDRLRHRAPSVGLPHPRVEARFVEVDDRSLLMNQLCELDSELLPLVDELLVKGGVIGCR